MVIGIVALVLTARAFGQLLEVFSKRRALSDGGTAKELEGMRSERKLLVERIENLETILCGVDLELNQKLNKLMDERLLTDGSAPRGHPTAASAATVPAAAIGPAAATASAGDPPVAHDRTMTAPPRPASSQGLSIGDVLANRYRVQRRERDCSRLRAPQRDATRAAPHSLRRSGRARRRDHVRSTP
jgi:hypothetical protein